MIPIVIDSNLLVATFDPKDVWHKSVLEIDEALLGFASRVILDVVVMESVSVIARRLEEKKQSDRFSEILTILQAELPTSLIRWISPLIRSSYTECIQLMIKYDGKLNFNDCLIVNYMKKFNVKYIASFDADFDSVDGVVCISSVADVHEKLL